MTKAPWDYSTPPADASKAVPNAPTPQGRELGEHLARLAAKELERMARQFPHAARPCDECAFVKGTIPNGCPSTLMDAIKCVVENEPFCCHKGVTGGGDPRTLCRGYVALMGAQDRLEHAVEKAGSKDALMSKRCDHGSEFEWAPVAGAWRIDRKPGCRCWWPEPASPEET